jgi:hypothetical protein
VTSLRAKVYKYETKLTLPRCQEKMMRCLVSLKQACTMPGLGNNEFKLVIANVSLVFLQCERKDGFDDG